MAEIKIEHKRSGGAWIWWVLGLLVIGALAWWLLAANEGDRIAGDTGEVDRTAPTMAAAVTDLSALTGAGAADLAGRPVMLRSAMVQEVVSDKGFWVGDGAGRVFVVRGDQSSAATPPDGAINAGQTVAIYGAAQRMPTDLTQQSAAWNLRSTDATALAAMPVYVQADSVMIQAR